MMVVSCFLLRLLDWVVGVCCVVGFVDYLW